MKRSVLLFILTAALAFAAPASADQFLLGFTGFDYDSVPTPPPDSAPTAVHYLEVGNQYHSLGFVTSVDPGMLGGYVDFSVNEYTYYMNGLYVQTVEYWDGDYLEVSFDNLSGRTRFYEDPISGGTHGDYGTNPPNATAPSTFVDGVVALGGRTYNFVVTYTISLGQRDGWILGGLSGTHSLSGPPNPNIPAGYDHQVSGECRRPGPTPTTHRTWGAIKALYR